LFYQARGYTVTDCFNQKTDNNGGGFTYAMFQAEINAGRPVLINLAGHSIVGFGYDTATNKVYIKDTWGNYTASMTWGGTYSGMGMRSVSIVRLTAALVPPTIIFPTGAISLTQPTYKWKPITGATKYELQLYKGSTKIFDYTVTSSVCPTPLQCSYKPAKILTVNSAYQWRIRAYKGAWSSYSAFAPFTVMPAGSSFSSPFTSTATGWTPVRGTWYLSGGLLRGAGILNKVSSIKHSNVYTNVTYTARIKRTTDASSANALYLRGTPAPLDSLYYWAQGYVFQYTNSGYYSIFKIINGTATTLKGWTTTATIVPYGYNILKVVNTGTTYKFYINGTLVCTGTDSGLSMGQLGLEYYQNTGLFLVDYVTATVMAASAEETPEDMTGVATFEPAPATFEEMTHSPE